MATRLILSGRVQGVFCRDYCRRLAADYKLSGSASNRPDGSVSVILDSDNSQLIEEYKRALQENRPGYRFYGEISAIRQESFEGPLEGDYNF